MMSFDDTENSSDEPNEDTDPPRSSAVLALERLLEIHTKELEPVLKSAIEIFEADWDRPDTKALKFQYKTLDDLDSVTIDIAAKLADYQSPKLTRIQRKSDDKHEFVIYTPSNVTNVETWVNQIAAE